MKESWALKNWCFWTVVLEKILESALDCKEIQPVHPKGNQSWIFTERTDTEAETPILWPPDAKNWLIEKTLIIGKIEGRRRWGWQRMRWLDGITDLMDLSLSTDWLTDWVSIYLLVDIWVVSTFWLLYIMVLWTGCTNDQSNSCSKLFWVHSGKWNCCAVY